jgi:hypothetical protein
MPGGRRGHERFRYFYSKLEVMFTLFRKEVAGFFSSLTGYIVMIVFLLANSLIMWIMPGQWNLLDSGYAGLDPLFVLSPMDIPLPGARHHHEALFGREKVRNH